MFTSANEIINENNENLQRVYTNNEIIYQKNPSNDFNISISNDNKYVDITFDYFDFEEGIVLQVFHTGNKSDDITLVGQIKSVKNIL